MENRGQISTAWLINKAVKTINLKTNKKAAESETVKEIKSAVEELEGIRRYYDLIDDPQLIDYAIYREKAAICRLSYLIRKAKGEAISY